MGTVKPAPAAKLFIASLIAPDGLDHVQQFDATLTDHFGPIDLISPNWPFESTDYYADDMGTDLTRRILSFERLIDPATLPDVKITTNQLEMDLTRQFRQPPTGRIINLDAGYLTLAQVVLATTKSYSHRLYLRNGIYAEVTLHYVKGRYEKWQWTYPDYAGGRYNDFYMNMRQKLKTQIANR